MPTPILATKLYIPPPRTGIVPRPHLVEQLNEGLSASRKLTLISAPAGFGKTTLVSEWVATFTSEKLSQKKNDTYTYSGRHIGRPLPVGVDLRVHPFLGQPQGFRSAWLSLDDGDNDLARFLTYFIVALQTIAPKIGEGILVAIQSSQLLPTEALLTTLLNEITLIPDNFILVLDDYHGIDSESIDQALTFLLDHLPPQMHLVITTREDPSLPLPRYRACGQLTELRAADLRFTPEEAGAFLNQMMNLNLSIENVAALEARTEGWIAGLQLAALSMQGRGDIDRFIQAFTGSHRFVLDYLIEEVLQHQPEHIRSFLLQTAILENFCAPLCNAVTEREDGKVMLDILERSNLFLIPLDDQRQWYRYHHLFAEVLQTHLVEVLLEWVATLHLRASAWYEQNGLRSDAIRHALAAKDFERAAGLIELAWPEAEAGSILPTAWISWVKELPEALVHARPVLTVWYAYALLGRGEMEAAEARFKDAERWVTPADPSNGQLETSYMETSPESSRRMVVVDQEEFRSLPATIAVGRAYIAQTLGKTADTARYARRVLELVPEGDSFRHSQAAMLLGMAYWASGDLKAADRVFADYTLKLRTAGNIPDAISTTVVLAEIRLAMGRLHDAIWTIEQLLQYVKDQGEPISPHAADMYRELGELYLEQGQLEAAAQQFHSSKELGEKAELPVLQYRWYIAQARLSVTQGDLDGALALLDEAERLYIRTPLPDSRPISAMKARIWLLQGRLVQALKWVREQGLSPDDELSYLREYDYITLTRILVARYQGEQTEDVIHAAMQLIYCLLKAAEEGNRMGSVIEILVLQALAHQAQGNITPALESLERALVLAEPEGHVRPFVDEGEAMRLLLENLSRNQDHPQTGYVNKLLAFFREPAGATPNSKIKNLKSEIVEPLSERELEVLRMLRTEMSGPEIARQLVVSLNTVRTHTQNIYAKLGVNNRRTAIRRAEELDLL